MITIGNRLRSRLCNHNRVQNNYTSLTETKKNLQCFSKNR